MNGRDPKDIHDLVNFEDLTPLHPEERFVLETEPQHIETRIVDLVAPIGKGQRAAGRRRPARARRCFCRR